MSEHAHDPWDTKSQLEYGKLALEMAEESKVELPGAVKTGLHGAEWLERGADVYKTVKGIRDGDAEEAVLGGLSTVGSFFGSSNPLGWAIKAGVKGWETGRWMDGKTDAYVKDHDYHDGLTSKEHRLAEGEKTEKMYGEGSTIGRIMGADRAAGVALQDNAMMLGNLGVFGGFSGLYDVASDRKHQAEAQLTAQHQKQQKEKQARESAANVARGQQAGAELNKLVQELMARAGVGKADAKAPGEIEMPNVDARRHEIEMPNVDMRRPRTHAAHTAAADVHGHYAH